MRRRGGIRCYARSKSSCLLTPQLWQSSKLQQPWHQRQPGNRGQQEVERMMHEEQTRSLYLKRDELFVHLLQQVNNNDQDFG